MHVRHAILNANLCRHLEPVRTRALKTYVTLVRHQHVHAALVLCLTLIEYMCVCVVLMHNM